MWKSAIARRFGARRYFRNADPPFGVPPTMLAYDAYGRWDPECPSGKSRGSVRRVFAAPGASREGALRTSETCPDVPASGRRFLLPGTKNPHRRSTARLSGRTPRHITGSGWPMRAISPA